MSAFRAQIILAAGLHVCFGERSRTAMSNLERLLAEDLRRLGEALIAA